MDSVLRAVERSNQRGGRMLSAPDLLEAGTLTLAQAAWLAWRIEQGASWLVGANPGGAGKTTVMGALLALLPAGETVHLTNPGTGWERAAPGECVVAYEISRGAYDAYIWGEPVQRLALLGRDGCRIVTNLHADTLEEARAQVVEDNGVAPADFPAFEIFLPVSVSGGFSNARRRVERIHHYENGAWRELDPQRQPGARERAIADFLQDCLGRNLRTIGDVRQAWLHWRTKAL